MSTVMRSIMTEQQWQFTNFIKNPMFDELMERLTVFCITRDPWERWNSAMQQYWYGQIQKNDGNETVIDTSVITKEELMKVRLDHHSDRQVDYLKGFDGAEIVRYKMGDPELAKLLNIETLPLRNMAKYRDIKVFIQQRIDEIMDEELEHTVKTYYKADYNFIQNGLLPK